MGVRIVLGDMLPKTVAWGVVFFTVFATEVMAFWTLAHVSNEVLKLVPTLADLDSTSAVAIVSVALFVVTSLHHGFPGSIGIVMASTRTKPPHMKVLDCFLDSVSAVAEERPKSLPFRNRFDCALGNKHPTPLTSDVSTVSAVPTSICLSEIGCQNLCLITTVTTAKPSGSFDLL